MSKKHNNNSVVDATSSDSSHKQPIKNLGFGEITITFSPLKAISLLMIIISALYGLDVYRDNKSVCDVVVEVNEDKYGWLPVPEHSSSALARYKHLDNGAFVYRHIYMDEFQKEFNVQPIHYPVYDIELARYLEKHDLVNRLRSNETIDQNIVTNILRESERYAPFLANIKAKVEKGTFVDDESVYVRWVNDDVRYGMFAAKDFVPRDFIGVYAGMITHRLTDLEYAWEFNYLVDINDENGQRIRACIDAKYYGNYLRFSNHRDNNQNAGQLYVAYNDIWNVVYLAQSYIRPHEQIFVNYGQGYWENKKKYDL